MPSAQSPKKAYDIIIKASVVILVILIIILIGVFVVDGDYYISIFTQNDETSSFTPTPRNNAITPSPKVSVIYTSPTIKPTPIPDPIMGDWQIVDSASIYYKQLVRFTEDGQFHMFKVWPDGTEHKVIGPLEGTWKRNYDYNNAYFITKFNDQFNAYIVDGKLNIEGSWGMTNGYILERH